MRIFSLRTAASPRLDLEREHTKELAPKKSRTWLKQKLFDYSKIVFSRESSYRGFINIFASDIPSLAAAACRNWSYFKEDLFKLTSSGMMMFAAPLITKLMIKLRAKDVFENEEDLKNAHNYMLFSNSDLESLESLDKSRMRITEEEIKDKQRIAEFYGKDSRQGKTALDRGNEIKNFMNNFTASEDLRKKIIGLKDKVISSACLVESSFWGLRPFAERLFRKYVLGFNRFTGSLNYLNDQEADKLGNKKTFTLKQMLGTSLSVGLPPLLIKLGLKATKNPQKVQSNEALKIMHSQMDLKHGLYPKLGLYAAFSDIPLLISKFFNAQDPFELIENLIRFTITGISVFLGDRITNGRLAKKEDAKLAEKYQTDPGILYYKNEHSKNNWLNNLQKSFPEATKYQDILDKTKDNPELQDEAIQKYHKVFFKGFFSHSIGAFMIKYLTNMLTQLLVENAKKKLK